MEGGGGGRGVGGLFLEFFGMDTICSSRHLIFSSFILFLHWGTLPSKTSEDVMFVANLLHIIVTKAVCLKTGKNVYGEERGGRVGLEQKEVGSSVFESLERSGSFNFQLPTGLVILFYNSNRSDLACISLTIPF